MKSTDQIRVFANGSVYVAPAGTAAPADFEAALDPLLIDLGYTSEDGVGMTKGRTIEPINVWQLLYPARRVITEEDLSINFALRQWSQDTVALAFDGGTFTAAGTGFKYEPPASPTLQEKLVVIEAVDGAYTYRWIFPKMIVQENGDTQLVRSSAADLPLTLGIIGVDGVAPWHLLTNDPAFDPGP